MRPLDPLSSIKTKLGVIILAAIGATLAVQALGFRAGLPLLLVLIVSAAIALGIVQILARGMTSPLREMVTAAKAMARGDYSRRVTATSRDEVGELARAFNVMAEELAEVDRMRRDLVANISHELRTPISALHAQLENMVDGVEPSNPGTFRSMLHQIERLEGLVSSLLELSKLEAGVVPMKVTSFPIKPVLEAAVNETRLATPEIEIRVDVDPSDLRILGDGERVHQVVSNLLANAARFSPPGKAIELTSRGNRDHVTIEVIDEGPGIPEDDRTRVFERFYRSDDSRSACEGGTGLGLAIARWIVDLHGGQIRAERASPSGCRMIVELPRAS